MQGIKLENKKESLQGIRRKRKVRKQTSKLRKKAKQERKKVRKP